jgi:hypothetical protein
MDEYFDQASIDRQKVYMPGVLVTFLGLARLLGFPLRLIRDLQYGKRPFQGSDGRIERERGDRRAVTATENSPKARWND